MLAAQEVQILPDDIYFLNLNNKAFKYQQSNDTLYEYRCAPTGECLPEYRKHYRIHRSEVIPPYSILRLERLDTIPLTTKPYPADRYHVFVLKNATAEKVGFAHVRYSLTHEQMESTEIDTVSLSTMFFYTFFSKEYLQEIQSYKKVETKGDVNRLIKKITSKEYQPILDAYNKTEIGDLYGSIITSEMLNKACLELGYSPIGANDVINEIKGKH